MRFTSCVLAKSFVALLFCALLKAQQPATQSSTSVPRLVSYAGRAIDVPHLVFATQRFEILLPTLAVGGNSIKR